MKSFWIIYCFLCLLFRKSKLAEARKEEGNEYYKQKDYTTALKLYSQAIGM